MSSIGPNPRSTIGSAPSVSIFSTSIGSIPHEFLRSRGYAVGKLFPRGFEFRPYTHHDEDFRGPNYIPVRLNRQDLLSALSV